MNATPVVYALAGLVLGLAASQGVVAFLISLALGVAGLIAGLVADGRLDLGHALGRDRNRR